MLECHIKTSWFSPSDYVIVSCSFPPILYRQTEMLSHSITAKSHTSEQFIWIFSSNRALPLNPDWETNTHGLSPLTVTSEYSGSTTAETQLKIRTCHGRDGPTNPRTQSESPQQKLVGRTTRFAEPFRLHCHSDLHRSASPMAECFRIIRSHCDSDGWWL